MKLVCGPGLCALVRALCPVVTDHSHSIGFDGKTIQSHLTRRLLPDRGTTSNQDAVCSCHRHYSTDSGRQICNGKEQTGTDPITSFVDGNLTRAPSGGVGSQRSETRGGGGFGATAIQLTAAIVANLLALTAACTEIRTNSSYVETIDVAKLDAGQ